VRMQGMSPESLANQIHVDSWASIGHMQHAHRERLNRREHVQRHGNLLGIGTVQTAENAHSHLQLFNLQEQPHGERSGKEH